MIFLWLVSLISWRWMDQVQHIALTIDLFVACVFIVIGIRFSITGLIDEFHLRSPFPITPYPIPDRAPIQGHQQFIVCLNCSKKILIDSNFCMYCGVKQQSGVDITLKNPSSNEC
jgi:hypothetical protein